MSTTATRLRQPIRTRRRQSPHDFESAPSCIRPNDLGHLSSTINLICNSLRTPRHRIWLDTVLQFSSSDPSPTLTGRPLFWPLDPPISSLTMSATASPSSVLLIFLPKLICLYTCFESLFALRTAQVAPLYPSALSSRRVVLCCPVPPLPQPFPLIACSCTLLSVRRRFPSTSGVRTIRDRAPQAVFINPHHKRMRCTLRLILSYGH